MPFRKPTGNDGRDGPLSASELAGNGYGRDSRLHLEELKSDLQHYQDLFENAPCAYLLLNLDGRILDANAGFSRLSGLPRDEEIGKSFRKLLTSAGAIYYDTQVLPSLLLNGARNEVALDIKIEQSRIPVLASFSLDYEAGIPHRIRVALFNATERRLYEKDLLRLRKKAEQLAEVILHSSDAIITLEVDGKVRYWNKGASDMFGYSSLEAVGGSLWTLVPFEVEASIAEAALHTLKKGREFSWETVSRHRSGSEIEVSIKLTPHMEAPGTLVAFSAIVRDVSKQKIAERALLQSEKLASVGRLASSIAHEINNPLAAVTNLLYLIDLQANTPELKELTEAAQDELSRVSQITTHTLRFHRQSSKPTDLNVKELFYAIVALYRSRLRNSMITTSISDKPVHLFCHEGELRQIVLNITGNAIDAMKLGGMLTLRCRRAKNVKSGLDGVRLTIADTGRGMEPAILARMFEPFFTTKGIGGTGLGLWVTRDLVQKNNGMMRARSSTADDRHGTIFTLFFPDGIR
jgi:PAS domain S-box-containing protein